MRFTVVASSLMTLFAIGTAVLLYEDHPKEIFVVASTPFEYPTKEQASVASSSYSTTTTLTSHLREAPTSTNDIEDTPVAVSTKDLPITVHKESTTSAPVSVPPTKPSVSVPPKPIVSNPYTPAPIIKTPLKWGVFAGSNPTTIKEFETKITENPDYLAYFIHWGNGAGALPKFLAEYANDKDRTLVLFWEASDYLIGGTVQPAFSYRTILRGDWDNYLKDFAKQTADYKGQIILIPFSELNGNWTPWSGTTNGNTPAEAVAAFRYVHGFFTGIDNVKFGLAVNAASVPNTTANAISAYYPGDEYVDYVGVDGFNVSSPWYTFDEIFRPALSVLSKYNKPMFIFSFASAEGNKKADWLDDALNTQMPKYPLLKGFIYFNQNKEHNWLLWSDTNTLKVFNEYVNTN